MGLWDSFTGSAGKKQAAATLAANNATAQSGYDANKNYLSQVYNAATSKLQPYAEQGQKASSAYGNLLGLNGAEAQGQARQGYEGWNPYLEQGMNLATKAVARRMNAGGNYNSGLNALAQNRATAELGSQDFYNYNDRLQGQGQQGMGAAGVMAGLDTGYGQAQVANQNMLSGQMMGNQNQYSNDYNQANGALWNNLMGLAGLGISGYSAYKGNTKPQQQTQPQGNNFWGYL